MRAFLLVLSLGACLGESALCRTRILGLRGGGVAAPVAPSTTASTDQDAPPAAIQMKVAACAKPQEGAGRVEVSAADLERMQLKNGDRLRVRKMQKAAFWSSVADQTLGTAVANPNLEAGKVHVYTSDVAELKLKPGDDVFVAPIIVAPSQAVAPAPSQTAVEHHHHHHHGHSFLHDYFLYRMIFGGPHMYGGFGNGRPRAYRTYRSSRRSGGMGRRRR